jgi:ABC-type transport system involved in multi-copper enzyme maturation permease subunit
MFLLGNPIFKREFSGMSRSAKNNIIIAAYLVLLSTALFALWPASGVHSVASAGGKQIFSMFFSINLTLILLIVPAFSAASITSEKEGNTFSSLFVTLLTPFEIMSGKLFSSVISLVLIVLFSMPIAAICSMTGGISDALFLRMLAVVLLAALSYGVAGLACSSMCERTSSSVVMNYSIIAIFAGASWFPAALLSNLLPAFQPYFQIIRAFSPYDAIFYLLYPETYKLTSRVMMGGGAINPFTIYIVFSGLFAIISFMIFERSIFRPSARAKIHQEQFTDFRKLVKRKLTWPFYLIDPLKRKKNIGTFSNPVFVAELRSRIFGNPKFVIRTVSVIFILSLAIMTLVAFQFGNMVSPDSVRMAAIVFQIGVIAMLAPGLSSGLITDEISSGTFVALRMTPLSPFTVVMGKLQATFFYAMIFLFSSFFVLFAIAFLEQQSVFPEGSILAGKWWDVVLQKARNMSWWIEVWTTYRRIVLWVLLLILSALVFLSSGLFASAFCKNTGAATAIAYVISASMCVVSFAPIILKSKLPPEISQIILSLNPIASALQVTNGSFGEYPGLWIQNIFMMSGIVVFFTASAMARTWWIFRS